MTKAVENTMVRCQYRSRRTGRCIVTFPARGQKKYCKPSHRVRACLDKGRGSIREQAIARDGGCVMNDNYCSWWKHSKKLFVRTIDPSRARTLDNTETLCSRHFAKKSAQRHQENVGPERYEAAKRLQGREFGQWKGLRQAMGRIFKGTAASAKATKKR